MEHVRSAAMYFLVPAGCAYDEETPGVAGVLADMITRGAGSRDSRELTMALDNLGLDRSESVGVWHTRFWGTTIAKNLGKGLALYADILRRPHLPEDELEACQLSALQDINSLEDEHSSKLMVELRKKLYPTPLSYDHRGTVEGIHAITSDRLRSQHERLYRPSSVILSIAGNIEWNQVLDVVGNLFGDWQGISPSQPAFGPEPDKRVHLNKELEQTHMALAYPSVPVGHPDYYLALGATNILSGGMGARLFTEIREKEGLCYSVSASYAPLKERGTVIGYAASLNHQAQRTMDKLVEELKRLGEGIEREEVDRVKVQLKTSLIMQQESTSARATSMAADWYNHGRVRRFDEIEAGIQSLTAESILRHVREYPARDFCIGTIGPAELTIRE
jgi:predicted Zn-dependent peptidase